MEANWMAVIFIIENFRVQNYRISMGGSILCEDLRVCNTQEFNQFLVKYHLLFG